MHSLMKATDSLLLNVETFFSLTVTSPMELYVMLHLEPDINQKNLYSKRCNLKSLLFTQFTVYYVASVCYRLSDKHIWT